MNIEFRCVDVGFKGYIGLIIASGLIMAAMVGHYMGKYADLCWCGI